VASQTLIDAYALALPGGPPLGVVEGMRLSDALGTLIGGLGCLGANVAQATQAIQRRLAAGEIDDRLSGELAELLSDAHQDVERACRQIARVRHAAGVEHAHDAEER
jgi:hypothetical protein